MIELFVFRQEIYDKLLEECNAIEEAIKEYREQKNSFIAEIRILEEQCSDMMATLLSSFAKLDELKGELRAAKDELDHCHENYLFDLSLND